MGATDTIIAGVIAGAVEGATLRIDRALADGSGLSRERVKALMDEGRVELAGKIATHEPFQANGREPWTYGERRRS